MDPVESTDAAMGEVEEEDEEEELELDTAWDDWESNGDDRQHDLLCLFCRTRFRSAETLFRHCSEAHDFNFPNFREELGLDFYGCVKLINFVRSKVAESEFYIASDLVSGLEKGGKLPWDDDSWLRPVLEDDDLLHCFDENVEFEFEDGGAVAGVYEEDPVRDFGEGVDLAGLVANGNSVCSAPSGSRTGAQVGGELGSSYMNGKSIKLGSCEADGVDGSVVEAAPDMGVKNRRVSFAKLAAKELKNANDSYFRSYGSFGIHREMLTDKVRMDAYGIALLENPSLLKGAIVMDVGCGTGILSLFAARAGASTVVAVEASEKMAGVAKLVAKQNKLLREDNEDGYCQQKGVIEVVHGMIEEIDKLIDMPQHSIDVLVSEWMGYCLLFETMLNSVLYARDHWLKPGGAILPDTATIFAAGFGRGGTSLPFWDNVHGFDMSCIGREVLEATTQSPIIDIIDAKDIITETTVLKEFDLTTMKPNEVDFTSSVELELKTDLPFDDTSEKNGITWCYGIVLWFETGFTSRFCRETPTMLSTSPYSPKTHWSQTIFTFEEPIALSRLSVPSSTCPSLGSIGNQGCPAIKIAARISIARSSVHRSIDISLETTASSADGGKRSFPVQIFDL